jgi:hypothetical protein
MEASEVIRAECNGSCFVEIGNLDRDREDFQLLFRAGLIDIDVLERRYHEELRPYFLENVDWHDKTLSLWLGIARSI